jgi:hypothetical protein
MGEISWLSLVGGGFVGAIFTQSVNSFKNRTQKMKCYYVDDDVLSKIPVKADNDEIHENVYVKKFKLVNTTNLDVKSFKVIFQFDKAAKVIDCYSVSKEGINKQKIKPNSKIQNEAEAVIKLFNREDEIEFIIKIANVSDNSYYISEFDCLGFKIKCKDKRKYSIRSKSKQSNILLINRPNILSKAI